MDKNMDNQRKQIRKILDQYKEGFITNEEAALQVVMLTSKPIIRATILQNNKPKESYLVEGTVGCEQAVDHLRWLNQKETEEGEPLIKVKGAYAIMAEPIEFTKSIYHI